MCVQNLVLYLRQKETNAKMTGSGRVKEANDNKMDLLLLDIFGKDNCSVSTMTAIFRLRKHLYISNRQSNLYLYCPPVYPHHLLSEMTRGIYTLALDTPCISPTE
jgi:hypothetical protein